MWDDRRKVGVLNDFDLPRFADQVGASGKDTGTLPFMALDLLSERGLRGEIPHRYRHEAESFAWSLIYLYFATVNGEKGNCTRNPHPLLKWFRDWETSLNFKRGLEWHNYDIDIDEIPLTYPNARDLAYVLQKYWVGRYIKQVTRPFKREDRPRPIAEMFNITLPTIEDPHYEEPEDDRVFQELLVRHEDALGIEPLLDIWDNLGKMGLKYQEIDWDAQTRFGRT